MSRFRKVRRFTLLTLAITMLTDQATAAADVSALITSRRIHMEAFRAAMQALGDQISNGAPKPAIVSQQATIIATQARDLPSWFPAGSGPTGQNDTAALSSVWQDASGFADRSTQLSRASQSLLDLARRGDMQDLMSQATLVDQACVACHQSFRKPTE